MSVRFPDIVSIPVNPFQIAIVGDCARAAFPKIVWSYVLKIELRIVVLIVASLALCETLGRDVPAIFASDFERVSALGPSQVVSDLIEVLNCELGPIAIRPNLKSIEVVKLQVGEVVQPRKAELSRVYDLREPVKANAELIQQRRRERVVLTQSKYVETVRFDSVKRRQIGCSVD